jgi:signal transduction histidine kinase
MNDKKIMIVEEGNLIIEAFSKSLSHLSAKASGQNTFFAFKGASPKEVLKEIMEKQPSVVAVDPFAFDSLGFRIIENILRHESSPVVVAVSEKKDPEIIVKLIKSGVYDYIVLNRDSVEIEHKIQHAVDAAEHHTLKKIHERELRILNGFFFNRSKSGKFKHINQDAALISSIRANFSQGGGIGSILTIISMIAQRAVRNNGKITMDENLLDMLENNAGQVQKIIDTFEKLENYTSEKPELVYTALEQVHDIINEEMRQISAIAHSYGKKIKVSEEISWGNKFVHWDSSYFKIIFNELLWNAVKFSPADTEIMVFIENVNHGILISVLNPPVKNVYGSMGIPEELKSLIFEPFFRLSRLVFEEIPTLDFGLGLTLVNMLVKKLNGSVMISNLESYISIGEKPGQLVSMELWLPTYRKTLAGFADQKSEAVTSPAMAGKTRAVQFT